MMCSAYKKKYVTVHHCTSLYVTVRHCTSLYVTVRYCTSLYITVHYCTSLCIRKENIMVAGDKIEKEQKTKNENS